MEYQEMEFHHPGQQLLVCYNKPDNIKSLNV